MDLNNVSAIFVEAFQVGGWPLVSLMLAVLIPSIMYRFQAPRGIKKTEAGVTIKDLEKRFLKMETTMENIEATNIECVHIASTIARRVEDIWLQINK